MVRVDEKEYFQEHSATDWELKNNAISRTFIVTSQIDIKLFCPNKVK